MIAEVPKVVVTGMGALAPVGIGVSAFWEALLEGKSGIGPITLFDASEHKSQMAGEVKNFDIRDYTDVPMNPKRVARHTQLGVAAALMAIEDAKLDLTSKNWNAHPLPLVLGVSTSALDVIENGMDRMLLKGPKRVPTTTVAECQPHAFANWLTKVLGVSTETRTLSSACAAGIDAVATAADMIRSGHADVVIAGGSDSPITPLTMACMGVSGLGSSQNGYPELASRPFDAFRDSGIAAEGAGILVLENLRHAQARGATCYLEIGGYGTSMDSNSDHPGDGLAKAMQMAITNSFVLNRDIDYICAHGSGDPKLDKTESRMIEQLLGPLSKNVPVTSIKGAIGNPLSAAGPLQIISCAMTFAQGLVPPVANLVQMEANCKLDLVMNSPARVKANTILLNAHALGGGNSSMVLQRVGSNE